MSSSSSSSPSSDAVSMPSLADLVDYLSYLAHKGHQKLPSLDDVIKRARVLTKAGRHEQMDVLTTALISSTVALVIGWILWKMWNRDEDTFAKARANKQITLLEDITGPKKKDNEAAKREKEKQQKKKEEKKKKAAASADSKEDKPAAAAAAPAAAKPESPKPAPAAAPAKKEQPKPEEPKKKETVAEPVVKKEEASAPLQSASPVSSHEQKKPAQANGDKKKDSKKAPKQVEEIENEEEFVEAKTKKAKKTEKKEVAPASEASAPRHLSLKDLDTNKVVARLSSIDEIEVEYIDYLNNYFRDTAANVAQAAKEAAIVKIRADESGRNLEKIRAEKTKLEGELENNRRLTHELATKAASAGSVEQELKSKLAAIEAEKEKLRREAEASKKAAASAAAAAAAIVIPVVPDNKEELEKLKADAKSAAARIADLMEELKASKDNAVKERKQLEQSVLLQKSHEDTALGQEVLLAESRQNAKAIGERLTGLEQERKSLEARLDDAHKQVDELKEQAKQREATHAADTLSLKTMIEELNKEVHRFEEAKKEQTEMVAKLAAKEAELIKKSAALVEAEKQITEIKKGSESSNSSAEAKIATLTKRVSELEAALAEEQKRAAEIVVPVAEPKKEVEVEEIVQLKKSAFLDAAPPADSGRVAELEKEVARLQEKNTELRTMNHSMVDQMNVLEKRFVANGVAAAPAAGPAPSTSAAGGEKTGGKKNKKGGEKKEEVKEAAAVAPKEEKKADEEERVRAERRLVQAHIGKLIGSTIDEAADTQAYEKWLKAAGSSIKEAQEKAKKKETASAPAPAPAVSAPAAASDEETEQLRTENNTLRDALFLVTEELRTIEQLKTDREEGYVQRIAELEKKHGKTK